MEITKELREKLLTANSEEEVKALLGDQATEEEAARAWHEIQKSREPGDLEQLDDDELEAVSGAGWCAFLGTYEKAKDGKDVGCLINDYFDWAEANERICPNGNETDGWYHEMVKVRQYRNSQGLTMATLQCTKCGKRKDLTYSYSDPMFGTPM
ncbi:MAG: hypothetical protein IKG87_17275 [Clostridia bacterium]|nr:hypothetical protein [Clostridia bacterium]